MTPPRPAPRSRSSPAREQRDPTPIAGGSTRVTLRPAHTRGGRRRQRSWDSPVPACLPSPPCPPKLRGARERRASRRMGAGSPCRAPRVNNPQRHLWSAVPYPAATGGAQAPVVLEE